MTFEIPAHDGKPAGRIRQQNEEIILKAAEDEFARHGFKGTSMNAIALKAGLPKANLHYYFTNKLGLYIAVLSNIIELWDSTFNSLSAEDDPAQALSSYIRAKIEFSRRQPEASRVFAMEIISGGACLTEYQALVAVADHQLAMAQTAELTQHRTAQQAGTDAITAADPGFCGAEARAFHRVTPLHQYGQRLSRRWLLDKKITGYV